MFHPRVNSSSIPVLCTAPLLGPEPAVAEHEFVPLLGALAAVLGFLVGGLQLHEFLLTLRSLPLPVCERSQK